MEKYLVPALLTFFVSYVLWLIQRPRRGLVYELIESDEFPDSQGTAKYFVLRLNNIGNTPIERIDLSVNFRKAQLKSVTVSNDKLVSGLTKTENALTTEVPLLNPRDELKMTITVSGTPEIDTPVVFARSTGVTARPKSNDAPYTLATGVVAPVAAGITIFLAVNTGMSWWSSRKQEALAKEITRIGDTGATKDDIQKALDDLAKRSNALEQTLAQREQGKPDREEIVFAVLNRAGLGHVMPDHIASGDELPYWKVGLSLMHCSLRNEGEAGQCVRALSELLTQGTDMAPSSYGFLAYLAGKIEQRRGNNEAAIALFQQCKTKTPLMYEHLMTQDPAYDLQSIQAHLLGRPDSKAERKGPNKASEATSEPAPGAASSSPQG